MTKEKTDNGERLSAEPRFFTLKLILTVVLAFGAALLFRRSAGILAMFPIAFILCGASALIDIQQVAKCAVFGITVFCINTIENDDVKISVIFTAICVIATAVFGYAASKIKKGKKYGYGMAAAGAVVCIVLSVTFVGNPFTAIDANEKINQYTETNYPNKENAALGNFEFSNIYYNYQIGSYAVDAVSSEYPTEGGTVSIGGDIIRDGFKSVMFDKISEPYVSLMASTLRESFPEERFTVEFDGFVSSPGEAILSAPEGALESNARYEIFIGGIQTGDDMIKQANRFVDALDRSGINYSTITFKSGIGIWFERCVTVDKYHPPYGFKAELDYYSTVNTNQFSEYIQKVILDKE